MIRAVVEATRAMLKIEFIKTTGIISELLVVYFEEHAVDVIEYEHVNSSESLAVGSEVGTLLRLTISKL